MARFGTPGPGASRLRWPHARGLRRLEPRRRVGGRPAASSTATGSSRPTRRGSSATLAGLTLLEAAAVGGETLAVDALANALGPVFRAEPSPGARRRRDERRRRQRGRAPPLAAERRRRDAAALARPGRARLRARLLLARERDRGARDLPPARRPARDARPARGVPPRRRHAVRARLRARRDAEPVHALQRRLPLRRAARLRRRAGAERLATGHYARIVERDGVPLLARGADPAKDQSYMLAALDPRQLARVCFPLGEQDKEATRAEAERAGLAAARRPESQEACFLAGDDYRAFLGRHGLERPGGRDRRRGRERARPPRRLLALHARPAARPRARRPRAALRPRHATGRERRRRRPARVARAHAT